MNGVFLKILNMSIAASWLILAVLLLRFVLKRAPRWVAVLLWGIVALRLAVPFSFESVLSLIPSAETFNTHNIQFETPAINSGIPAVNNAVNPVLGEAFAPNPVGSVNPLYVWTFVVSVLWLVGVAAMLLYAVISYARVRRSVAESVPYADNIFLCDRVQSPFILGVVRPKIYLPSNLDAMDPAPVIAHEKAHLARRDHWWKPLGFLILTVHWFNPLCWIAYVLLCRDIELACDEKVIRQMDLDGKKQYSTALLECSTGRRLVTICPLAFGEVGVKERVKSVLNYKKPAFWVIVVAVVACAVVTVCFATNPISAENYIRLQSTYSAPPAAFFSLDLAKGVQGTVIAERWENGRCTSTNPVSMNDLTQQIQLYLDPQDNGVNVQLGVDNGDTILELFAYPAGKNPDAWAFVSLDEGEKTALQFGKDRVIAAMAFDFGSGVISYSCDALSADQKQVENAAYMIVIRTFLGSGDSVEAGQTTPDEEPPAVIMDGEHAPKEPDFSTLSTEQTAIRQAILDHNKASNSRPYDVACCSFVTLETVSGTPLAGDSPHKTAYYGWVLYDEQAASPWVLLVENKASDPQAYDIADCNFVPLTTSGTLIHESRHKITYYGWALYEEYQVTERGLETVGGSHKPVALSFDIDENGYTLTEYWEPRDGSDYAQDIREKFPAHIVEDGLDSQKFILQQKQVCYAQAAAAIGLDTNPVIGKLLETICGSPALSSNPEDYIEEHPIEYRELTYYGRHTLIYCFNRFEKGGETGLAGHIMMRVCGDIAAGWGEEPLEFFLPYNAVLTGQAWYDAFKNNALNLMAQCSEMELAERYPASYLLLSMLGEV